MERGLTLLCDYLNNYEFGNEVKIFAGDFKIENGALVNAPSIADGQYYRIKGSALNDAVYQYPETHLNDEEFTGEIWLMYVPLAVIELVDDIAAFEADPANAPTAYTSESFGGYSYTRGTDSDTGAPASWQTVFKKRLNRWRKVW